MLYSCLFLLDTWNNLNTQKSITNKMFNLTSSCFLKMISNYLLNQWLNYKLTIYKIANPTLGKLV